MKEDGVELGGKEGKHGRCSPFWLFSESLGSSLSATHPEQSFRQLCVGLTYRFYCHVCAYRSSTRVFTAVKRRAHKMSEVFTKDGRLVGSFVR